MELMHNIKAIIVLNLSGSRLLAKYFDDKLNNKQFERKIFAKTRSHKNREDIFVIDDALGVHKMISELHIYIIGSRSENPLILDRVLNCLVEVTSTLLKRNPEDPTLPGNLSQFLLAFDEICDGGIILEMDPNLILDRVCLRNGVAEQSLAQVIQNATEIRFPWIRS